MTENKYVKEWVAEMAELTAPDAVVWIPAKRSRQRSSASRLCLPEKLFNSIRKSSPAVIFTERR